MITLKKKNDMVTSLFSFGFSDCRNVELSNRFLIWNAVYFARHNKPKVLLLINLFIKTWSRILQDHPSSSCKLLCSSWCFHLAPLPWMLVLPSFFLMLVMLSNFWMLLWCFLWLQTANSKHSPFDISLIVVHWSESLVGGILINSSDSSLLFTKGFF